MRKLFTIILLAISTVVSATRYYVSNTGNDASAGTTTATAWKTVAKVNSKVFAAGDEISFLRGGVWREQLKVSGSGNSGNPVVFSSYGTGDSPIITGADKIDVFSGGGGGIWDATGIITEPKVVLINRALGTKVGSRAACTSTGNWFWTANTLSVYSSGNPSGLVEAGSRHRVVDTQGNSFLTFTGITFECSNNDGSYMLYTATANASEIKFYNCVFQYSAGYGLQFNGTSSTTACVVDGSTIRYNWKDGIYVQKDGDITINNCKVYSNGLYKASAFNGIFGWLGGVKITNCDIYDNGRNDILSHGIYQFLTSAPVTITNCTIHDQPNGAGVRLRGSATVTNCKIYNNSHSGFNLNTNEIYNVDYTINDNLVYGNKVYGIMQGIAKGTGNVKISVNNNTFYNNGSDATILIAPVIQGLILRNNIFHGGTSGGSVVSIANSSTTAHSNNLYYRSGTGDLKYIIKDGTSVYGSGVLAWEPTAVTGDPLFNSTTDFHLQQGSPAIGKGIAISGIVKDLSGVSYKNPPDIGCYQSSYSAPVPPPAPVYLTSSISESSPDAIEITYDLSLATVIPEVTAFNVKVNSVDRAVTAVKIVDGEVKLTIAKPVVTGDKTTLSYVKPSVNPLQSKTGGVAESIFSKSVTNSVITAALDTVPEPVTDTVPEPEAVVEAAVEASSAPAQTEPLAPGVKITVYPNPVHHVLNILCEYSSTYSGQEAIIAPNSIKIFDMAGRLMLEKRLDPGVTSQQFPVNFRSGVFVVVLVSKGLTLSSQKFIVYN
jgi:parallel beta-helix repeat protein